MTKTNSKAAKLAKSDASVAALLPNPGDYTDDFIRRTELQESDRAAYKTAWYAEFATTRRAFGL